MAILKTANYKGKYHDPSAKGMVIRYVLNPYKAPNYIGYNRVDINHPAESMAATSAQFGKSHGVQLRHFIISFDVDEINDPALANEIAYQFMQFFAHEYQAVYAIHEGTENIHIHLVINSVSYIDGHRYYGTRAEFKSMQKYMQQVLQRYGIYTLQYVSADKPIMSDET